MKVLFVCSSNRSRSPLAAAYFRHCAAEAGLQDVEIESAGLRAHPDLQICDEVREVLAAEGLQPLRIGCSLLRPKDAKTSDVIICMTSDQKREIETKFFSAARKTKTLMSVINSSADVFDPHREGVERYAQCLAMMKPALEELARRLL